MNDVAILNFNMGNLFSVKCALNYVGLKSVVTDNAEIIKNSKSLIIPGVGAFPEAMKRLKTPIKEKTEKTFTQEEVKNLVSDAFTSGLNFGLSIKNDR